MAKAGPSKTATSGGSRRDRLASFEAARRKEQRVRTIRLLVICLVAFALLLAYPVYLFVQDYQARNATIDTLGVPLASAGCDAPTENPATGNQDHVPDGTPIQYPQTPPDSGQHYASPANFFKHFYATSDRPAVGTLVHNLEHGYTIAWYRPDAPADQVDQLETIAKTFSSDDYDPTKKFIAAPWSETDGGGFPEGKNVVLARWTANPDSPGDASQQKGVRQNCSTVSGAAIQDFMVKYPVQNSPEPNAA